MRRRLRTLCAPAAPAACIGGRCQPGTFGDPCTDARSTFWDFLHANKACNDTADCQALQVGCGITEDDCTGAVYVNAETAMPEFERLRERLYACSGGCAMCKRVVSAAQCVAGLCQRHEFPTPLPDPCGQPIVAGVCDAYFPVYGFNGTECVSFIYGGCEGNDNRFETLEACQEACGR